VTAAEWRDIADSRGVYQINEEGQVRHIGTRLQLRDGTWVAKEPRPVPLKHTSDGRERVRLWLNNVPVIRDVSALVAETFGS